MTIAEAIAMIDYIRPNPYPDGYKIMLLSGLDMRVFNEFISTRREPEISSFEGYTSSTPTTTVLLVKSPHDEMYIYYLDAMINYALGDTVGYTRGITAFNTAYRDFGRYYNRKYIHV